MTNFLKLIAFRFVLRGTEAGRLSAMTLFAWLAIGVGVGAMCSLLSVMYGFESTLRDRVLTAFPHVIVKSKSGNSITGYEEWTPKLKATAGVVSAVPFVEGEMIIQSNARTMGAIVWGIPGDEIDKMRDKITGIPPMRESKLPQLVIGSELASMLDVSPGDRVKIISPLSKSGAMGAVPLSDTFEISGLYTSGHYNFDKDYLFLLMNDAQDLLKRGNAVSGWHVWGEDAEHGAMLQPVLSAMIPESWDAQSWTVFNSALFQSLKLEQYSMFTILTFAILIAVMNVVITLMMNVNHKRKNIGILRALGASQAQIRKAFFYQGVILGGTGLILGAILTVVVLSVIKFASFQLPAYYYDRSIPFEVRPWSLVLVFTVAVVLILLATIYPSQKAAEQDPIAAIRE